MIGDKIKELRTNKDISQEKLSEHLGVTKNAISSWENNRTEPSSDMIKKIAEYFHVTTDYLLGANQNKTDIEIIKMRLNEAGVIYGDDLSIEELQKALQIINILKNK